MVEKIGTIKNPLTIIAIFAAIVEISGTAVLPFISARNQDIYIWFSMGFPILLVVLFFLTLNFNRRVLYAPSDFRDETNFFKSLREASPEERQTKLRAEVKEAQGPERKELAAQSYRSVLDRYSMAEELVLTKIAQQLGEPVRRHVLFSTSGRKFIFDGIVVTPDRFVAIEVKYFRDQTSIRDRLKLVFHSVLDAAERLPDAQRSVFSLILAIATDVPVSDHAGMKKLVDESVGVTPFPVDIRIFTLDELERELKPAR